MLTNIKALIVILGIAIPVFLVAKEPLCRAGISVSDYDRRRALFIGVTLIAFLAPGFWVFVALCGVLLATVGRRDSNALALFCFLLFAAPPFAKAIPGFGPVNALFDVNYYRLLTLCLLAPLALRTYTARKEEKDAAWRLPDVLIASLVAWMFIAQLVHGEGATASLRRGFEFFVDIWIPYYVASRALKSEKDFADVLASLVLAIGISAVLAIFESMRSWLLYENLGNSWGLPSGPFTQFQLRGILRAKTTPFDSIALGYTFMIGLTLLFYLGPRLMSRQALWCAGVALVGGLIATVSRGPWVGTLVAAIVASFMGPGALSRGAVLTIGAGILVTVVLISPFGDTLISYLPFVGTVDASTADFRGQLFSISLLVLQKNLLFGNLDFTSDPLMQQLVQGTGFIDVVNTYVQFALPYGLFGLVPFVLAFAFAILALIRTHKKNQTTNPEVERLGRALLGTIAGILVTIATVSSVSVVPMMYWLMLGIVVSYGTAFGVPRAREASQVQRHKSGRLQYRNHYR